MRGTGREGGGKQPAEGISRVFPSWSFLLLLRQHLPARRGPAAGGRVTAVSPGSPGRPGLLLRAGAQRSGSSCVVSCRHAWPWGHPCLAPAPPFSFHPSVSNPSFPPRPPSLHLLPSPGAGGPAGPSKPFTPQLAEGTWAAGNMNTKSLLPFQPILTPLSQSPRYLSPKLCLSKVHGAFHQLLRLSLLLTHTTW